MSSVQPISVHADIEGVQQALKGTAKSMKSIRKQALGIVGRVESKAVRQAITASTGKRTGDLRKAYSYKVAKDGSTVTVWPRPKDKMEEGRKVFLKSVILSYGYDAGHRKGPHVAARNFVQKGREAIDRGDYVAELQKMIDKELKKYWG